MNGWNVWETIILVVLTIIGFVLGTLISFELTQTWTGEIIVLLRVAIIGIVAAIGGFAGLTLGVVICSKMN